MSKNYWNRRLIDIPAGVVYEHSCLQKSNVLLVRNHTAAPIYVDQSAGMTIANADVIAGAGAWGVLSVVNDFDKVYILSAVPITGLKIYEGWVQDPVTFIQTMTSGGALSADVNVTGTVGLTAGQLSLQPITRFLNAAIADPLPAGANKIGKVDIDAALPAGANKIGKVDIDAALPAGANNIGKVDIDTALPAGANKIGKVDIDAALPAGTNNIGKVDTGKPTTPVTFEIEMTLADTEYSQALPDGTQILSMWVRDGVSGDNYRLAWETGKVAGIVAPCQKLNCNMGKSLDGMNLTGKTLYFACSAAGKIMQIETIS